MKNVEEKQRLTLYVPTDMALRFRSLAEDQHRSLSALFTIVWGEWEEYDEASKRA